MLLCFWDIILEKVKSVEIWSMSNSPFYNGFIFYNVFLYFRMYEKKIIEYSIVN